MRLILFDIDGTLIRSDGAGRMALEAALIDVYGTAGPISTYRMSGKTDAMIVTELMTAAGMATGEIEAGLPDVYAQMAVHGRRVFPERQMTRCTGVEALLAALRARSDAVIGLLTGNISSTAPLKLAAAGIDPEQFRVGAYGSDHADRNQLPRIAMTRATELTGCTFIGMQTTIIGDTPADIVCARAGQANAVAVATGWHSTETLAQYDPDYLFENLADTAAVLAALFDLA